jgi:hypothetical protein
LTKQQVSFTPPAECIGTFFVGACPVNTDDSCAPKKLGPPIMDEPTNREFFRQDYDREGLGGNGGRVA